MIFIKGYAETNAEPTKSITLIVENAIALKDFTLFKEPAQNVCMEKFIMNILKYVVLFLAKGSINFIAILLSNVYANLNM